MPHDISKMVLIRWARNPPEKRFWARVKKTPVCWEWTGAKKPHGYGFIGVNKRWIMAHRFSWELANGPIPDGLFVCHKCDNPGCVKPSHLFLGTQAANIRDCIHKHRFVKRRGFRTGTAKLSVADVRRIRKDVKGGARQVDIAKRYGMSPGHIWRIVNRHRRVFVQ